jgi:purine nucleosidase
MTTIIDCDPGNDDAIALLLAMASPEIALSAITVVAGNVGVERTAINALEIVELAGRDVPVFAGAARPLIHALVTAAHIHGETGMQGLVLPRPRQALSPVHAVDHIRAVLRAAPARSVTLCPVGPLTNIALVLATEPALASAIKAIVLMGGAIGLGNTTPAAEFNIYVDPHAAQIVFASGAPIVMVPLELTHQALATAPRVAAIRAIANAPAQAVADLLDAHTPREKFGFQGGPVHDACAVGYLVRPELMSGRECRVTIDTTDGPSRGRTIVDWWGRGAAANALVLDRIDADGFFALLTERLGRY